MRVVIVGPNLPNAAKATFHVHREGCADLRRGWIAPYARGEHATEVESFADMVSDVFQDIIAERDEDSDNSDLDGEFHLAPCVKGLPEQSAMLESIIHDCGLMDECGC